MSAQRVAAAGAVLFGAALGIAAMPASAADHTDLEEGLPIVIEDAYPLKYNSLEAQGYFRYERTGRDPKGDNRLWFVPRFEAGLFPNFQFTVEVPYRWGDASETKQGDFRAKGLYNFNTEGLFAPAMSIAGGVDQPFGEQAGGTETELTFLATKSIGPFDLSGASPLSYVPTRLHLNATWFHNYDPRPEERRDRYRIGVAYSQPVANDWVVVADLYRETKREKDQAENVAELGVRYMLTPQTVLAGSVGAGFGDTSPDFRIVVGLQHTLSFPFSFDPPR